MKHILYIIIALLALVACQDIDTLSPDALQKSDDLKVSIRVPRFDDVDVSTRGTKSGAESKVSNMYMFIIDNSKNIAYRQYEDSEKPLFTIDRSDLASQGKVLTNARIVVVANCSATQKSFLDGASNLEGINLCDFPVEGIDIPSLGFPMMGWYDIDLHNPAQNEEDKLKGSVIEIPLDCVYSKIVFNISVQPLMSIDGVDQSFHLKSWRVFNIPTQVRLDEQLTAAGLPDETSETPWTNGNFINSETRSDTNKGDNMIYESSQETDSLTFYFYLPEHKIIPHHGANYPWDPVDNEKYADYRQYLKPTLVEDPTSPIHPCDTDQKATYVEISGTFMDHNRNERDVIYTIFLGKDNYSNFQTLRNKQYNNDIIIKGIKNNSSVGDEHWVTYDHRVNVTQEDFTFGLQRETLLDSHWEIRPIRIDFNKAEAEDAVVEVIVPNDCNWLSIESPSASTITNNSTKANYCDVGNTSTAYGKRRYYTTNLNETLNNTKKITIRRNVTNDHTIAKIDGHDSHTVWAYIDEYVDTRASASQYRYTTVRCNYYASSAAYNNGKGTPTVSEDYIFRQNNLHKITYNGNTYYIEYYEEYLYNYDSKEQYGNTSDGMEWGLDGEQLSSKYGAVAMGDINIVANGLIKGTVEDKVRNQWNNVVTNQLKEAKKYDFYLSRDVNSINNGSSLTARDRSGLDFTKEIAIAAGIDLKKLTTKDSPESAIEYCLNKNKRNDDGSIALNNIKWYMPAIDEIEDITSGGYGDFDVFQDKLYWSSQPAYKKFKVEFNGTYSSALGSTKASATAEGAYFEDNTNRARATKTKMNGTARENVNSATNTNGSEYIWGTMKYTHSFKVTWYLITSTISEETFESTPPEYNPGNDATFDEGNCPRTGKKNRVRCVYKTLKQ